MRTALQTNRNNKISSTKNKNDTHFLSPASDLLNGCLSSLTIVRNSVVRFEGFLSPSDHSMFLSVKSVDDVLAF